jgi:hypothetical protein
MKKTKRSRIALWLLTCLALLVATLACRAQTETATFVVDDFAPTGVGPANPINDDYYTWAFNYSSGQISNVWWNWFGGAFNTNNNIGVQWDSTADASNNPSSGSMKINAYFNTNLLGNNQFTIWDQGATNNYFAINSFGLTNLTVTNFECDFRFAPGSASDIGNRGEDAPPIFGHLRFGIRNNQGYGQDWFGAVDVPATNTAWTHFSTPLDVIADPNLTNITCVIIGIDANYYSLNLNGPSTLWVDNIKFEGHYPQNPPPTLGIQPATPALRIFAGSGTDVNGREQLDTLDQNQSWVGGTYPVSYSFTLLSFPTVPAGSVFRFHIFLVPTNNYDTKNSTIHFTGNEYVEYQARKDLWLNVSGTNPDYVTAVIQWKTNAPNQNPTNTALFITNSTAVGTWTLTFSNSNSGALTAPGRASPVPFSIPALDASKFTNPMVAFFGVQPDSQWGEGQYVDVSHIQTIGVRGVPVNDDFTTDTAINTAIWDTSDSAQPSSLVLVTTNTPYWMSWTMPDTGFEAGLAVATDVGAPTNHWMLPEYYNYYNDGNYIPGTVLQGIMKWTPIPSTCLPTVDGQPQSGQPLSPDAFFKLFNPPQQY